MTTRRTAAAIVPLTLAIGVQEQFGWLIDAAGSQPRRLCELVRISSREAVLTSLEDGSKVIAAAGTARWQPLRREVACSLVSIPAPPRHNQWRLDPFWVERHRSAVWRAIVELVVERGLPVHYAAVMFARGEWDRAAWDGPCADSAAIFACGVQETMARGLDLRSALAARLDADHALDVMQDPMRRAAVLLDTGWHEALRELDARISAHRAAIAQGRSLPAPAAPARVWTAPDGIAASGDPDALVEPPQLPGMEDPQHEVQDSSPGETGLAMRSLLAGQGR